MSACLRGGFVHVMESLRRDRNGFPFVSHWKADLGSSTHSHGSTLGQGYRGKDKKWIGSSARGPVNSFSGYRALCKSAEKSVGKHRKDFAGNRPSPTPALQPERSRSLDTKSLLIPPGANSSVSMSGVTWNLRTDERLRTYTVDSLWEGTFDAFLLPPRTSIP